MTTEGLVALLVVIYLLDALTIVRDEDVVFVSCWGRRFHVARPGLFFQALLPTAEVLRASPSSRDRSVDDPSHDVPTMQETWRRQRRFIPIARTTGTVQFVLVFLALPLVVLPHPSLYVDTPRILAAIGAVHIANVVLAVLMLRCGRRSAHGIASAVARIALVPLDSMRAVAVASHTLYSGRDPVALGALALDDTTFAGLARRELHRTQVRAGSERGGGGPTRRERGILRLTRLRGLPPPDAPPARLDPAFARYCPVCWVQYDERAVSCSDCGIALRRFSA